MSEGVSDEILAKHRSLIGAKHRGVHWHIQDTSDLPSHETAKTYS